MARWPRFAGAGSPGTSWVRMNATSVIPTHNSAAVAMRRARTRSSPPERAGRCRPAATAAAGLSELTDVDQPNRVGLHVLHRLGADQDLCRLDQRHDRPGVVHRLLDLLVQHGPLLVVDGRRGLLAE